MVVSLESQQVKLVATAVAASVLTFSAIKAYQTISHRRLRRQLDIDASGSIAKTYNFPMEPRNEQGREKSFTTTPSKSSVYDEELIREQLARNYAFFGENGMARIREGRVVIVGCGGVGSYAALMLARSGVSKIRLVDFDYVTLSSLNRHATALLSDVGTPKVKCVERTIRDIAKWVEVDSRVDIWRAGEDGGQLLEGADWVIDAIDNIATKVDLLKYCHDHGIKVFASMGAGAKADPTRVQISDISYTVYDPLARSVRRRLRSLGVVSGIPVVYSTETPGHVRLLPLPEEEFQRGRVNELSVFDDFRVRILPVIGPLPSIFGLHIAAYILCELAGTPITNPLPIRHRHKAYERLLRDLTAREAKIAGSEHQKKLPLEEDDISFIYEDLHRGGRSIIPPHSVPTRSALTRWDLNEPLCLENCVVMELSDADLHWKEFAQNGKRPVDVWGEDVASLVARRQDEVKRWKEWVL